MSEQSGSDTILIVDDEEQMRVVIQRILEDEGYSCLAAEDGIEAQEVIRSKVGALSAVLLDWTMPRMTGIDLLRWMKEEPRIEHIPVIMETAMDKPSFIKEGIEAGAFYYLTKPIERDVLLSVVKAAIDDFHFTQGLLRKLQECGNPFAVLEEATFRLRTLYEAETLAARIANAAPDPERTMVIAELINNAVEHGNLGIDYEEKTKLVSEGKWFAEVERRLALPENANKHVRVHLKKEQGNLFVEIEDQGPGFDFERFLTIDESRLFDNHGRGIAIAGSSLDVRFVRPGNKVIVSISLQ